MEPCEDLSGVDAKFIDSTATCLKQYIELWQHLGLARDKMASRLDELWVHVGSRLQEIYEEEFGVFQNTQNRIKNLESAVDNMARVLQVEANKGEGKLLTRQRFLREELERLAKVKEERLELFSQLQSEKSEASAALNMGPSAQLRGRRAVPTEKDLEELRRESHLYTCERTLQEELEKLAEMKHERLELFSQLQSEKSEASAALNMGPSAQLRGRRAVPTEKDLEELRREVEDLKAELSRRTNFLHKGHSELCGAVARGEWSPESVFEKELLGTAPEGLPLTQETVDLMEAVLSKVRTQVESLSGRRKTLVGRLNRLWKSLDVAESEQMRFPNDCRLQTLLVMEAEVDRLEGVRKRKMGSLVSKLRTELEDLWDKCHVTESERRKFRSSAFSEINGGVLELHEDEVAKWRQFHSEAAPILAKMDRRQKLWDQMLGLEANNDPKRFQNRGCRLLQEEKERRRLQKQLPALEEEIFRDLEEYELMSGAPLLYRGQDYRSFVSDQWAQRLNQKEFEKQERRRRSTESTPATTPSSGCRSRTPSRAITPRKGSKSSSGGSSAGCTPLGMRNIGRLFGTPSSAKKERLEEGLEPLAVKILEENRSNDVFGSASKKELKKVPVTPQRRAPTPHRKTPTPLTKDPPPAKPTPLEHASMNGTTYTDFVDGLDHSNFHSSVLTEKNGKPGRKVKKTGGISRKSVRATRTTNKFMPKRGKLGLPFLI